MTCKPLRNSVAPPLDFSDSGPKIFSLSDTRSCEIIQLSAICGDKTFNAYTVPVGPVDQGATEVTGLSVNEGRLCHWETPVPTVPLPEVFTSFLAFLRSFPGPVLLAAHNAKFDWVVLARVLDQFPHLLLQFQRVVPGYLDTLLLSRRLHPDLPNYKLSSLVSYFLEEAFDAHNAEEDARVLQQLFYFWNPEESTYSEFITYV